MKKNYILLIALIVLAGCTCPQEKTFKNPIFYERMTGYNEHSYEFILTPDAMRVVGSEASSNEGRIFPCELIENNATSILLRCLHSIRRRPGQSENVKDVDFYDYTRFISVGKTERYPDKCVILSAVKSTIEEFENSKFGERFVPWKDCGPTEPQSKYELLFNREELQ